MNNKDSWTSVNTIIENGFTSEGLAQLDNYAEQFFNRKLLYKRFSPREQSGCSTGGVNHVIASLLAGAKAGSSDGTEIITDFKREPELSGGTRTLTTEIELIN